MGILDDFFAQNGGQGAPTQPQQKPAMPQSYPDFYNRLIAATNANIDAQAPLTGRGIVNLLTGNDRKAALANVARSAPDLWDAFKQAQAASQNAQLGTARDLAATGAMTGQQIDPNNIAAAVPGMTQAYSGAFNGAPSTGGIPTPTADPVQQQRAWLERMMRFSQLTGNTPGATEFFKAANQGLPAGTVVRPDGQVADAITGQPVTGDVGSLLAQRAGETAAADTAPRVAGQIKVAGNQAALDRGTAAIENADKARYDTVTGYDNTNGQPLTITKAAYANGAVPGFTAGDNPYLAKHQTEIENANKDANDAANTIIQLKTLGAALNGIHTGAWGDDIQGIRRGLASIGLSDPALQSAATKGDIANQIGLEVAALRARAASGGRTALGTLNAFRSVKPGLLSTNPQAQIQSLIPAYQRQIDYANFVNHYYGPGPNWNKLDAPTQFQKANPDQRYVNASGLTGTPPSPESIGLPAGAKFLGWHQGKAVFNVNGKRMIEQ